MHKLICFSVLCIGMMLVSLSLGDSQVRAVSASDWQAGKIIDDAVFFHKDSMSVQQVQQFLNAKVPNCDYLGSQPSNTWYAAAGRYYTRAERGAMVGNPAPFTCLKDYRENPSNNQNNYGNINASIPGAISAAQIIWNAAQQYNINPQVLLVTLQKEQGLITDDWPFRSQYIHAMGANCPDTPAGCDPAYSGFATQVNRAAYLFNYYKNNINQFNFNVGSNYILWNVASTGCGGGNVNIQNISTAMLYIYTPYQPNSASLNAFPGQGDGCSSYGNRNFWYYFNDWFGSTQTITPYAWSYYGQEAYSDPGMSQPFSSTVTIGPNQKVYLRVKAMNIGNQTWSSNSVRIGTSSPYERKSYFEDQTWYSSTRPAQLKQSTVKPGEIGEFEFVLKAPSSTGTYIERFNLVAENITWLNDRGLFFEVNITLPSSPNNSNDNTLAPGQFISVNQYLLSPDSNSILLLQADGNLVLYRNFMPVWSSSTSGRPSNKLIMQNDGNLVLYTISGAPIWHTGTHGTNGASLVLTTDGKAVIENNGINIWSGGGSHNPNLLSYINTNMGTARLYPGQQLQTADRQYSLKLQNDGNLVLYKYSSPIWNTYTYGKNSAFLSLQADGNLVLYDKNYRALWSSKTSGMGYSRLLIQQDGNLVLYTSSNQASWHTSTFKYR